MNSEGEGSFLCIHMWFSRFDYLKFGYLSASLQHAIPAVWLIQYIDFTASKEQVNKNNFRDKLLQINMYYISKCPQSSDIKEFVASGLVEVVKGNDPNFHWDSKFIQET